jgi:hypothetical protein
MKCSEAQTLLSAYFDGELSTELHDSMSAHLAACEQCAAELEDFAALSSMAKRLTTPAAPPTIWTELGQRLETEAASAGKMTLRSRQRRLAIVVAATILAVMLATAAVYLRPGHHDHQLTENFDRYLNQFLDDPAAAEAVLLSNYEGQAVTPAEAERRLAYRPVALANQPPGYTRQAVYLLNMPCCKCTQVVFRREDGALVTVFEHDTDQPIWFEDRPSITARCSGKSIRIVQLDGQLLAASWPLTRRHLTIIGVHDVHEVTDLIDHFGSHESGL